MTTSKSSTVAKVGKRGSVRASATPNADLSNPDFSLPFFAYLTIPTNTVRATPLEYDLTIPIGYVRRLWVEFPKGCAGLVGVQIWRGVYQQFPLPEGVWFRSDNSILNFAFTHDMTYEPHALTIKCYNLDDSYIHTIWVGVEVTGKPAGVSEKLALFLNTL